MPETITVAEVISLLVGVGGILSGLVLVLKSKSEARKILADAAKSTAEAKKIEIDGRKVEVEVAEKFITSAGDLIGTYKDMLETFTAKYNELEKKLTDVQKGLEQEIGKRRNNERIILEIYRGVKILLAQQEKAKLVPEWKPDAKLEKELKKFESNESFGD